MASKKKGTASEENRKKNKPKAGPAIKPTPKATDDDFGLDDIDDLSPLEDSTDDLELATEESSETVEETTPIIASVPAAEPTPVVVVADAPKPRNVNPKKEEEEEKKGGMLWLIILIILLILAAVYYFGFYKKQTPEPVVPPVKVEEKKPEPTPEPVVLPVKKPAELFTISAPEGRYFAVVGSFFDEDLAEDLGKKLVKSGVSAYLLKPTGSAVYHRVGLLMEDISTMKAADANLTSYREQYGNTVWALKY
jgi:hypothetical protein